MNRIPRKMKKKYKKLWIQRGMVKFTIVKKSIKKDLWGDRINLTWGCIINHK